VANCGTYVHVAYVNNDELFYVRNTCLGENHAWETPDKLVGEGIESLERSIDICATGTYAYIVMA